MELNTKGLGKLAARRVDTMFVLEEPITKGVHGRVAQQGVPGKPLSSGAHTTTMSTVGQPNTEGGACQ